MIKNYNTTYAKTVKPRYYQKRGLYIVTSFPELYAKAIRVLHKEGKKFDCKVIKDTYIVKEVIK